jgi:predicted DCC family thiol-disulfide oxidoreductase YuxK
VAIQPSRQPARLPGLGLVPVPGIGLTRVDVHTILFDGSCGFCRWSLALILRWDRGRLLRPVSLEDVEADRLLTGMPEAVRMASWHLVRPDGVVLSAGSAAGPLFRLLPGGGPLASLFERFPRLTEAGYRCIAQHRNVPGRLLTERAKERADRQIEERARLTARVCEDQPRVR